MENLVLSVSDFIALTNQTLEYAYPSVEIEGEVAEFKVNQNKYVFFNLKDAESSVGCFMMVFALRVPIEDGMKVVIKAAPKLTKWGKFSLTVQQIRPSGEGSLKKSFELLRAKLDKEGLFDPSRKRPLPVMPQRLAVISSTQAAGYADFIKILDDRWGGVDVQVAHVQVQGEGAADQIIRAVRHFNEQQLPADLVVLIRGGGSADDLSVFNDEPLVRAIAASRIPVVTGIGHETDESLVDLAADFAAATPSNVAQLIVPDRQSIRQEARHTLVRIMGQMTSAVESLSETLTQKQSRALEVIGHRLSDAEAQLARRQELLRLLDPRHVLERGYAIMRGKAAPGASIEIETALHLIQAEVHHVTKK